MKFIFTAESPVRRVAPPGARKRVQFGPRATKVTAGDVCPTFDSNRRGKAPETPPDA
jgi:hypothetical protein